MLSPITPSQFVTALAAGLLIAAMAAIFTRLDAAARQMVVVRRRLTRSPRRRDDE